MRRRLKRLLDLSGAAVGLGVGAAPLAAIAALVWRDVGWPILFRQRRSGQRGRGFLLYKFRTMRDLVDAQGAPLPDAERLTPFGRWLRSTSLDELPELWNVLKGEMSLVGPRPLLPAYDERYTAAQARRLEVPPGLTGLAIVEGRSALSWEERLALDRWYVEHWSLWLDAKILLRTVAVVLRREGTHMPGEATNTEFKGTD